MAGEASTRAAQIRAELDHPIVDSDGHFVEVEPQMHDEILAYLEETSPALRDRYLAGSVSPTDTTSSLADNPLDVARERWTSAPSWWGWPTENVRDRATSHLPRLLDERLDEIGLDFTILYPSMSLAFLDMHSDPELAGALCRAVNRMHARVFAPYASRMCVGALIPMNTPDVAIETLDDAVAHGFKAGVISGFALRPIEKLERTYGTLEPPVVRYDTFGLDSAYDYDPFWARCALHRFAPVAHSSTQRYHVARSPTNYVYNHVGGIGRSQEALAKSLLMGGVTRRFPELRIGFLEGGVAWACSLFADLIGHWEKRNARAIGSLDPDRLDVEALLAYFDEYATEDVQARRERVKAYFARPAARRAQLDDFAAAGIEKVQDLHDLFIPHFYFGCEADDPLAAWAFAERINPEGARLRAMLGSDIAHWDVTDFTLPVEEAWELVERGSMGRPEFREFAFLNAVRLHAGMNPDFFHGTAVEAQAAEAVANELD
jgi:predicted TIM-barrel fold metal-dependent hydrolase